MPSFPDSLHQSSCNAFIDASNTTSALCRCPGDCSGNGQCWYGTCTCHVGYVGEDCKQRACSTGSCPGGFKCNLLLGRCESNEGVFVAPKDPPTSATKPKPQPVSRHSKFQVCCPCT